MKSYIDSYEALKKTHSYYANTCVKIETTGDDTVFESIFLMSTTI